MIKDSDISLVAHIIRSMKAIGPAATPESTARAILANLSANGWRGPAEATESAPENSEGWRSDKTEASATSAVEANRLGHAYPVFTHDR